MVEGVMTKRKLRGGRYSARAILCAVFVFVGGGGGGGCRRPKSVFHEPTTTTIN